MTRTTAERERAGVQASVRHPAAIGVVGVVGRTDPDRRGRRIGVNAGSLDPRLHARDGSVTPEAMVESALHELALFEDVGFTDVKFSVKASNVRLRIEAYRQLAAATDHPLHLGVTEAGPGPNGVIKATAGIATLLADGIGDTIRYPLTADPVDEARAGRALLEALNLRERRSVDLIACPSCGRAEIDVLKVANEALEALGQRNIPLQVAVMGCVVNGPGEARDADLGIAAGRRKGHLFVKGRNVAVVPEDQMVTALVRWAELIVRRRPRLRPRPSRPQRHPRGSRRPPGHPRQRSQPDHPTSPAVALRTAAMIDAPSAALANQVRSYYSERTAAILHEYGPGPRVHFHVGTFSASQSLATIVEQAVPQRRLVESQERVLAQGGHLPPCSKLAVGAAPSTGLRSTGRT